MPASTRAFSSRQRHRLYWSYLRSQSWFELPYALATLHATVVDDIDKSHDPLTRYAPAPWKRAWPVFTADILKNMDIDQLAVRKRFVQMELEMTLAMHRAGVRFMAGTDTAAGVHVFPGFSLHEELALFVEAGLTPMEALQTATIAAARAMKMDREVGTIERGKRADMVVLNANPLDSIRNIRSVRWTISGGRVYDAPALWKSVRFQP